MRRRPWASARLCVEGALNRSSRFDAAKARLAVEVYTVSGKGLRDGLGKLLLLRKSAESGNFFKVAPCHETKNSYIRVPQPLAVSL